MFGGSKGKSPTLSSDWTNSLREVNFYKIAHLRSFGPLGEITCTAVDPVLSLLAVGTSTGLVHLIGSPAFQCTLYLSGRRELPSASVKFLTFHPGANRLVAIDDKDTLHSWFLGQGCMDDSKGLPTKEVTTSLLGNVTFVDIPSPSQSHLFISLKDGNVLAFDLARRNLSPYRIPNAWSAHEERLRRSGVPKLKNFQVPLAVCIAMSPRDLDCLLIGYEGGVVAWKMSAMEAVNTYTMILPPGSPGGSSYHDPIIWSERTPAVTCLSWRPDGLAFAVGYDDGCIAIWAYDDPDKPLMVRTLKQEDVNVTDAESLLAAGALDSQIRRKADREGAVDESNTREPIFKLVWASFPDEAGMTALIAAQNGNSVEEPLTKTTVDYADKGETVLVVLGGCKPKELPAIHLLQFSAYIPAKLPKGMTPRASEGLSHLDRTAFRQSLNVTGMTTYPTATPAEDFSLVPRSSPYFGLAHDPIAIVITLTPDPALPPTDGPRAARGIEVFTFPPPRSDQPPEEQGRKDYPSPLFQKELEGAVPMTLAPSSPGLLTAGSPTTSSWRLPWSSAPASPNIASMFGNRQAKARPARPLRLPSLFWNGGMSMLGVEVFSLSTFVFKRLIAWSIEQQGSEDKPRMPLRGGMAVPDLVSANAPDPRAVKIEPYRIMATWSVDGAVRFWDISPHILVLPPSQLRFEYPSPLPHLTISITNLLKHPSLAHLPIAKILKENPTQVRITGVDLAMDSLECAISMSTGEVFVYKFGEGQDGPDSEAKLPQAQDFEDSPKDEYFPVSVEAMGFTAPDEAILVDEITTLGHLASRRTDGFRPVCLLITRRGPVVRAALSDIGFLAVAYANKSLAVLDLRGPEVILREGFNEEGIKVKKRRKGSQNLPRESQQIRTIKWTISKLGADPVTAPRLIASYAGGLNKIFTLSQVLGEWVVDPKALSFSHDQLSNPLASFVMNLEGEEVLATSDSLSYAIRSATNDAHLPQDKSPHCVWVACSGRSIRASVNYSGERVGKVELGPEEELVQAFLVQKNGNKVLVGLSRNGVGHAYSLPALDPIAGFNMRTFPDKPIGRISMDPKSGDYIEYLSPLEIHLRTMFYYRKPLLPRIDPFTIKRAIPAQPVPLASNWGISSWIWGGAPFTGSQLDALVAGPNRPPVPKNMSGKPAQPLITWGQVPDSAPKPMPAKLGPRKVQAIPEPSKYERVDVYSEMTKAAEERGLTLDNLNQQMENVVVGAADMLKSARNAAAKETAKASAKSMFKF